VQDSVAVRSPTAGLALKQCDAARGHTTGASLAGSESPTVRDADFTLFNDLADPFGIQNPPVLANITESAFDTLNLEALARRSVRSSLPSVSMSPSTFR